jgi:hypothetical protein
MHYFGRYTHELANVSMRQRLLHLGDEVRWHDEENACLSRHSFT